MTTKVLFSQLDVIQAQILVNRTTFRSHVRRWLVQLLQPADRVAGKFDQQEMSMLVIAYESIPWSSLENIDPRAANILADPECLSGAVSQRLAGALMQLVSEATDCRFNSVLEGFEGRTGHSVVGLARKVHALPAEEASALQVLLEGAREVGAAVPDWWHPVVMMRLLNHRDSDRLHLDPGSAD
jgi:hypothetical protein